MIRRPPRSTRCLLEDVHDRYPARSDPGTAGLFLAPHFEISFDLSAWRRGGSQRLHASTRPYLDRFHRHGYSRVSFNQADWAKLGYSLGHGLGTVNRRRNYVVSRCPLPPFAGGAHGRYDPAASRLDRFRPNRLRSISWHIAVDFDNPRG